MICHHMHNFENTINLHQCKKKDEDNCRFIKSLQCADDTVNDSVAKDEGIHGVFNEVSVDEVPTVEINGNVDRDTENQPNEKININSGEKPQDEVLSNVDVAPPPIASARSNKSIRCSRSAAAHPDKDRHLSRAT